MSTYHPVLSSLIKLLTLSNCSCCMRAMPIYNPVSNAVNKIKYLAETVRFNCRISCYCIIWEDNHEWWVSKFVGKVVPVLNYAPHHEDIYLT